MDSDDYLGRCVVYLQDSSYSTSDTIPKPTWHNITFNGRKDEPACGQMLLSFVVVESDFSFQTPLSYSRIGDTINYMEF